MDADSNPPVDGRAPRYCRADAARRQRDRRHALHLRQAEVAWHSRITQAALSNYETGKRDIPLPTLLALCEVLRVAPEKLVPGLGTLPEA